MGKFWKYAGGQKIFGIFITEANGGAQAGKQEKT
jgi:hypothetical protein